MDSTLLSSTVPDDARHALQLALNIRNACDWAALERFCIDARQRFPHDIELAWQLSHCYWLRHDSEGAEAVMREAASGQPVDANALKAIAFYMSEQARFDEAEAMYREALSLDSGDGTIAVDLADLELRRGAWREGWTRFERRLERARVQKNVVRFVENEVPRWRGESLAGRRIVVYSELGIGDDIQFVRLYPRFAEAIRRIGGEACLAVRSALYPLVRRFVADCIAIESNELSGSDYSLGMMSMPLALGLMPSQIDGNPYLDVEPERIDAWRSWLASDGKRALKVGLVWAGSPTHRRDSQRSMPVDALAPLWHLSDVTYYTVAPGRDADIASMRAAGANLVEAAPHYREDFHDSAALVCALDLLVTVDSSPLHLGGALGRPVIGMLDRTSHWCWGFGETQPWYDSVALVRQHRAGDWTPVMARVADELARRASLRNA